MSKMISQETAQKALGNLLKIPAGKRRGHVEESIRYLSTLTSNYKAPEARTVKEQVELVSVCSFGSPRYMDEVLNLVGTKPNDYDPKNNTVSKIKRLGEFTAYVAVSPEKANAIVKKVESLQMPEVGMRVFLQGLDEHPSCTGAIALTHDLETRWGVSLEKQK